MPDTERIQEVNISQEMRNSFLDYAMSVIVSRALPDVRDGLKPVHRRILYSMFELGITPDKPYKKSANVVGNVLARYHPHGDAAVYDSMVRMAQDFSYRYMLIDGHGNFGSVDGDSPAAMRYTEARLAPIALEMLRDTKKETIDFGPNYDGSLEVPLMSPSRTLNLLIDVASRIDFNMTTNIPANSHREVINALDTPIETPNMTGEELMKSINGPECPTGGVILGTD